VEFGFQDDALNSPFLLQIDREKSHSERKTSAVFHSIDGGISFGSVIQLF
jgi:hypothetical protein